MQVHTGVSRRGEAVFVLDILFHRMSVIEISLIDQRLRLAERAYKPLVSSHVALGPLPITSGCDSSH
jgi:hypothetical protein